MPSRSTSYDYPKDNQVEDTQKIYYKAPIAEPIDEATSSIGSPTYSTMQPPSFSFINVISTPLKSTKITYVKISIPKKTKLKRNGSFHTLI